MTTIHSATDWTKFLARTVALGATLAIGLAGTLLGAIFTLNAAISGEPMESILRAAAVAIGGIAALIAAVALGALAALAVATLLPGRRSAQQERR